MTTGTGGSRSFRAALFTLLFAAGLRLYAFGSGWRSAIGGCSRWAPSVCRGARTDRRRVAALPGGCRHRHRDGAARAAPFARWFPCSPGSPARTSPWPQVSRPCSRSSAPSSPARLPRRTRPAATVRRTEVPDAVHPRHPPRHRRRAPRAGNRHPQPVSRNVVPDDPPRITSETVGAASLIFVVSSNSSVDARHRMDARPRHGAGR